MNHTFTLSFPGLGINGLTINSVAVHNLFVSDGSVLSNDKVSTADYVYDIDLISIDLEASNTSTLVANYYAMTLRVDGLVVTGATLSNANPVGYVVGANYNELVDSTIIANQVVVNGVTEQRYWIDLR